MNQLSLNKKRKYLIIAVLGLIVMGSFILVQDRKPVLYIVGDSTVKNGDGKGRDTLWGWGSFMDSHFDTSRIEVQNHAIGGRSTRTFITDNRWSKILTTLQKGDYVIIQFGHNDASPLDDTARARGTLKGIEDDSVEIYNPIKKIKEVVHSYGWYLRKFINETKQVGAIPIICSPVPRNNFTNGKINRSVDYAVWAKEICDQTQTIFLDLHNLIADKYDKLGENKVNQFFPKDHTHTNLDGALLNTEVVIDAIKKSKAGALKNYLQ
jgi:lysophospholipase L1-like esterase